MSTVKPLVVVLALENHSLIQQIHADLLAALNERSELHIAKTKPEALRYLTSSSRPHAVVVYDPAPSHPEYLDVLLHLVRYVESGGTAVYAGVFGSFVEFPALEFMFQVAWGLPWSRGSYTRSVLKLNGTAKGLNIRELPRKYYANAAYVSGVTSASAVYLEPRVLKKLLRNKHKTPTPHEDPLETPAAFTKVGKGHLGYVGDVNNETATTALVVQMCFHRASHAPVAPGTGVPPPVPKRTVLIISLEKEEWTDSMFETLYRALRKNASMTEVENPREAIEALSATPPPSAVLVSDATINRRAHAALLSRLVEYNRAGGTVVLGMQFSNTLSGSGRAFFGKWGLEWDRGDYHRTTFELNPAGIPAPLSPAALFPSISAKALHIEGASREHAVYLPAANARVQSHVFAATPIVGEHAEQSPAVFARVGEGFLGYVGDVNAEHEGIRLTLEMLGMKIQPGDLGSTTKTTGVSFMGGVQREVTTRVEPETPLPTVSQRPREAEVAARSKQRAETRAEKDQRAESMKLEGNAFFAQQSWVRAADKYRAAAMTAGPKPVLLSNLAAALLKLQLWEAADSATSRVLLQEPNHPKALYRRAIARKEQGRFPAAKADLEHILRLDRRNAAALAELNALEVARTRKDAFSYDWPGDLELGTGTRQSDGPLEPEEESDSEDFKHGKSGSAPCKKYNHDGCEHGTRCRLRHAPDEKSVRDQLGRNVCVYWLLGTCRFGDERCVYAHDRTYLPPRGWWAGVRRIDHLRKDFNAAVAAAPREGVEESIIAEAFKPVSWRKDVWTFGDYGEMATRHAEREKAYEADLAELNRLRGLGGAGGGPPTAAAVRHGEASGSGGAEDYHSDDTEDEDEYPSEGSEDDEEEA